MNATPWLRRSPFVLVSLLAACGGPQEDPAAVGARTSAAALTTTVVSPPGTPTVSLTVPSQGTVGTPLGVTVTVTNDAAVDAASASLGVSFPLGSQLGGHLPVECVKVGPNLLICSLGALAAGASASEAITVTPEAAGPFVLGAFGSISYVPGVFQSSGADATIDVVPGPTDVQVTGFASTGSPPLGRTFTYTFQVKNNGPQVAGAVAFADTLPSSLGLVGAATTAAGGSCTAAAGQVACALGDLAVGAQVNVVVTAVAPSTAGTVSDTAAVTSTWGDLKPDNNSVTVTVQPR